MLVVALTGGIGSGKSTVTDLFRDYGTPVIDTDEIARQVVAPGEPLLQEIHTLFGERYFNADGSLDRRALRELIFSDAQARQKLEALLHPVIHARVLQALQAITSDYCLLVIPLLATSQYPYPYDRVLLVDASEGQRIQRVSRRDDQSETSTRQMIAAQVSRERLLALADDVIDNNGNLAQTAEQVASLHRKYLDLARNADTH